MGKLFRRGFPIYLNPIRRDILPDIRIIQGDEEKNYFLILHLPSSWISFNMHEGRAKKEHWILIYSFLKKGSCVMSVNEKTQVKFTYSLSIASLINMVLQIGIKII